MQHLIVVAHPLEQEDVRAAAVLTMLYPLWWATMPAMMKGYIDRVFARGFADEARGGVVRGLMDGKRCVLITLSGSPFSKLLENGEWKAMDTLQDAQMADAAREHRPQRWLCPAHEIDDYRDDENGSKDAAAEIHDLLLLPYVKSFDHKPTHTSGRQRTQVRIEFAAVKGAYPA